MAIGAGEGEDRNPRSYLHIPTLSPPQPFPCSCMKIIYIPNQTRELGTQSRIFFKRSSRKLDVLFLITLSNTK